MGGAHALASHRIFKQFAREVNAALPRPDAVRNLRWIKQVIAFDPKDQLKCTAARSGAASARCSGGAENPRPSLPQEEEVTKAVTHRASGC